MRGALAAIACLALVPAAHAQEAPPVTPQEPPPPAATTLTLALDGAQRLDGAAYVLPRQRIAAKGRMRPATKGERVVIRVRRGGREVWARRVAVGADGAFRAVWRADRAGAVRIVAVHEPSPAFARARSRAKSLEVIRPVVGPGAGGPAVALYQRGLERLRYAVPRSGRWDDATARASMAYRKVNRMPRRFSASGAIVRRVWEGRGAFRARRSYRGRHVEADLSRQVMALVRDGRVRRVYHVSSGAPATPTVVGTFRVYRKDPGTNSLGMVHSTYFIRGYAIHGYKSVPPWNASHGCLRVPIPDAWSIYRWVRMGDRVVVYP